MIDKDVLMDIGLTKNETEVYLYLLQTEEALAGEISKSTKISRTYIYDTIQRLQQKGFVSYVIRNGKRFYRAAEPEKIIDYLKFQESNVNLILPQLIALRKPTTSKPIIEVYDGAQGMKNIFTILYKVRPKDWLIMGSSGKSAEVLGEDFADIMESRRVKLGIKMKALMTKTEKGIKTAQRLISYRLTEVRYMSQDYENMVATYIFGDYVTMMLWMKEKPLAILIKDRDIASSFEKHFYVMWALASKTPN